MSKILVVAEQRDGELKKVTLSAVTFARRMVEKQGGSFDIVVIGSGVGAAANALAEYGAEKIHVADNPALEKYLGQSWAAAAASVAESIGADIVCATADAFGKDILPRVAARLNAGMASDVVDIGEGEKTYTRSLFAGNLLADVEIQTDRQVVSVRGSNFPAAQPQGGKSVIETAGVDLPELRMSFVDLAEVKSERPELTEAKIVISGGRGLKEGANFVLLEPIADLLGAAIGASRAAVDAGWVPNDYQVGQTGKIVAPELYIAVGISGAIQHLAGMKSSKCIVAINKDEEAPIFQVADYGLVADLFKVLPELEEEIRKLKAA